MDLEQAVDKNNEEHPDDKPLDDICYFIIGDKYNGVYCQQLFYSYFNYRTINIIDNININIYTYIVLYVYHIYIL